MLKIGEFSKLTRISIRMLRYYDEIQLLTPQNIDIFTSYRYYSEEQMVLANRITALKDMGFSLLVVKEILNSYHNAETLSQFLLIQQKEISSQLEEAKYKMKLIETAVKQIRKDDNKMNYNVTLKTLPERCVASVRKIIPSYQDEGLLWKTLMEETGNLNMKDGEPCYALALFHDQGYKETDVDVEVQKNIIGKYENTQNVIFKTEPPVQIASSVYKGSYEQITKVNEAVANWVVSNGYAFDGTMFTIYHVSPHETQNPEEFVSEICYPVKKNK